MKIAYSLTDLYNLSVIKEARRWKDYGLINNAQWEAIRGSHISKLYHPNLIIRILLFIATNLAFAGVIGILALMFQDVGETGYGVLSILGGIGAFTFAEKVFVESNYHYKSGVVESIIYHGGGYVLLGVGMLTDGNPHITLLFSIAVFSFMGIRYLDLVSTTLAVLSFTGFIFLECYEIGGIFRQVIPFVIITVFSGIYWGTQLLKKREDLDAWNYPLIVVESLSLLLIYAGGNYMVVRELSISMMDLSLSEGQDIPFALLFYGLTAAIPIFYLVRAIRKKDVVMLRVGLVILAFTVFTFKFYFSLGHPEITLTLAGAILLAVAGWLFQYLKAPRGGFTRENLLKEKWGDSNVSAFVISQTMGGNEVKQKDGFSGGGGEFGGGGASGSF